MLQKIFLSEFFVYYQSSDGFHIKEGVGDMSDDQRSIFHAWKQISLFECLCEVLELLRSFCISRIGLLLLNSWFVDDDRILIRIRNTR